MNPTDDYAFEGARLLVVDDDPILRQFAETHLSDAGFHIDTAEDGFAAWQRLQARDIDLAVVDLDMPRMNGFELIELIRGDTHMKHLPLVVITGREDTVAIDHAYAAGATSFVVKPVRWRLLVHQLTYVLRSSRAEAQLRRELEARRPPLRAAG